MSASDSRTPTTPRVRRAGPDSSTRSASCASRSGSQHAHRRSHAHHAATVGSPSRFRAGTRPNRHWRRSAASSAAPATMPGAGASVSSETTSRRHTTSSSRSWTVRSRRPDGPPHLVGWSLGGVIARETARLRPELVHRVVTFGTPAIGGPTYTAGADRMGAEECRRIEQLQTELDESNPIGTPITAVYTDATVSSTGVPASTATRRTSNTSRSDRHTSDSASTPTSGRSLPEHCPRDLPVSRPGDHRRDGRERTRRAPHDHPRRRTRGHARQDRHVLVDLRPRATDARCARSAQMIGSKGSVG